MKPVSVQEAKAHFSKLLAKVQRGQEVTISKSGKPVARLVPVAPARQPRRLGTAKGQIWIADDFDAPLPDDLLKQFYGE